MATLNLSGVIEESIVDGPGLRYVVFTQGCPHHCKGCHNPETWSLEPNNLVTVEALYDDIRKNPIVKGVTFSGGEPFLQAAELLPLATQLRCDGYNVMAYTGYTLEQILQGYQTQRDFLHTLDYLVDGPFVMALRTLELPFRGSSNQRLIDVQSYLRSGKIGEVQDEGVSYVRQPSVDFGGLSSCCR